MGRTSCDIKRARYVMVRRFLLGFKCFSNLVKILRSHRFVRQKLFQFFARIVVAVGAGLDFFFFSAGSYLADFSAPTRKCIRLAPATVYVLWFEINLKSFSPLFRYLLFPFNVLRLSRFERSAFVAVQSTIGDHFRHDLSVSIFQHILFQVMQLAR